MQVVPSFVARAALRVLGGGLMCAALVAGAGVAGARLRFGVDVPAARERIAQDVQQQLAALETVLDRALTPLLADASLAQVSEARDVAGAREIFNRLSASVSRLSVSEVAITLYGAEARPLAWTGRPANVPVLRITGPDALFLAQSSLGLRLTRVTPVIDPTAPDRRLATLVAEAPLAQIAGVPSGGGNLVDTSVVPVLLRPSLGLGPSDAVVVRSPTGEPLATLDVPAEDIERALQRWRTGVVALVLAVGCAVLLLLTGPMLDWRRMVRPVPGHAALTLAILMAILAARLLAWVSVRLARLDEPALLAPHAAGPYWLLLASPIDFLLTSLAFGAIVALVGSTFEQWRQSRQRRVRVVPEGGPATAGLFVIAQLLGGLLAGVIVFVYEDFLRTRLASIPYDILHFSLQPVEPMRLSVGVGLIVLHAALLALAVLVCRIARSPWVIAAGHPWVRASVPLLWAAPGVALVSGGMTTWEQPPRIQAIVVIAAGVVAAWFLPRFRAAMSHASQAARLTTLFVIFVLPSVAFYPSLVDAADRARRQLIEARYAPEVINQRRDLQTQLSEALGQIESVDDLEYLVSAQGPAPAGPPSADAAFLIWSRTALANQRSTSIELHDASGALVSRFALELPQGSGPQEYQESTCNWEVFEEVSPFFAEERPLLHGGRGICRGAVPEPRGAMAASGSSSAPPRREVVGAIAAHVMLDYSNLSFVSAQSPYAALLGDARRQNQAPAGGSVELTVYGWSRRPLFMSGRDAWPLEEDVFQRVYASREPFWARVVRSDTEYEVYFLNDRGAIYALGYPRAGMFAHLISIAELTALTAATFLLLLLAGFVFGLIAARTPMSGRALLREVRASFYRKLFIAFVAVAVIPVLALALVTRAYITGLMQADLEMEATRTAASASRVVEDVGILDTTDAVGTATIDDNLVVWLSRVIAQDVNIFSGPGLLASSERNLFASGLLPTRTDGDVYRAIVLEGRPSYVGRETVGTYSYLVAAAPVRVQNRDAILTVPLTLRQQEIDAQIEELNRRVLLGALLFIMLGAGMGYSMAERIADPVNRLTRATGRIARGDLDARILATSSDEFRRLVEAFNGMAADLQRQRVELERTNRLAAWADMARQVAHDIKNPLTPIQLNAEHLRRVHDDRGTPLGRVLDECVANILTQVRLLRQIASEFSSFASSPSVKPAPVVLHDLISEVIQPYRTGLSGHVLIDSDVPVTLPKVMVDKAVLARALTNVIENSLHAMPGGGRLRLEGTACLERTVCLRVIDSGVGMDRDALDRIFEPYFSTRASGTGLGLTIAKRNVELNHGSIHVESERGRGTTVTITLPTADARSPSE